MNRTPLSARAARAALAACALALAVLAGAPPRAAATTLSRDYEFSPSAVRIHAAAAGLAVDLEGGVHRNAPGEPDLPALAVALELPAGEHVVSWRVSQLDAVLLVAHGRVAPAPAILKRDGTWETAPPSAAYSSTVPADAEFPQSPCGDLHTGGLQGHALATVQLHPLQWNPATGSLRLTRRFRLEVTTAPGGGPALPRARRTELTESVTARALSALHVPFTPRWDPLESTCRHASLSIL